MPPEPKEPNEPKLRLPVFTGEQPGRDRHEVTTLPDGPRGAGEQPTLLAGLPETPAPVGIESLTVLGTQHYAVIRELGRGGMGRVSVAFEQRMQRLVAVKELLRPGADAAERFAREALVTARLQHPAIVPVYEAGRWPSGQPFYAMKLLTGRPLGDLIRECQTVEERLALVPHLLPVSDAVAYAHQKNVLHRDLKPDNIVVGDFGETVVIDWGLAKLLDGPPDPVAPLELPDDPLSEESQTPRPPSSGTRAGTRMGTPGYASPEQAAGLPIDERTDVYALGAMLYQILTGFAPRSLPGLESMTSLDAPIIKPPEFPKAAPGALVAVCRRALSLDRADRQPSALAFRNDLEAAQQRRSAELLAGETLRKVEALEEELRHAERDRHTLYTLFGACRFGFEQVLGRYPDDELATAGLIRAMSAMVRFELDARDLKAARAILADLANPPAELVAELHALEAQLAAEHAHQSELLVLGRQHDVRTGSRTRLALSILIGGAWTAAPPISSLMEPLAYWHYTLVSAIFLVAILTLGFVFRKMVTTTAVNRALLGGALVLQAAQILMYAGDALLGIPIAETDTQHLFLWSVVSAGMALALDARVFVSSAAYALGFLVAARYPHARKWLMSAGNLVLTLTAVWLWRPGVMKSPLAKS